MRDFFFVVLALCFVTTSFAATVCTWEDTEHHRSDDNGGTMGETTPDKESCKAQCQNDCTGANFVPNGLCELFYTDVEIGDYGDGSPFIFLNRTCVEVTTTQPGAASNTTERGTAAKNCQLSGLLAVLILTTSGKSAEVMPNGFTDLEKVLRDCDNVYSCEVNQKQDTKKDAGEGNLEAKEGPTYISLSSILKISD